MARIATRVASLARARLAAAAGGLALLVAACGGGGGEPPPWPEVALAPALGGARFERPVEAGAYPGGRVFVAEQGGLVVVLDADGGGRRTLLDLRGRVDARRGEGLLSVALEPGFARHGRLWAYYFAAGEPPRTVLARFAAADGGDGAADAADGLEALALPQPGYNQNGGAIRFGPDGMLYLGLGDGSASADPFANGQNRGTLLGSVIRIDVREASAARPYATPPGNPFAAEPGARGEIWAYGLRNPWRMAFDPEGGALWLGDVGFSGAEEVNRAGRGDNLGWSVLEGFACLRPAAACERAGLTPPVAAYAHEAGRCAVTGGLVYRGEAIPALRGAYLYGDYCSGEIFALRPPPEDAEAATALAEPFALADGAGAVVSFGLGADGEALVVDHGGAIWRIAPR